MDPEYLAHKYEDKQDAEEATGTGRVYRTNKGATASKHVLDEEGLAASGDTCGRHEADLQNATPFRFERASRW